MVELLIAIGVGSLVLSLSLWLFVAIEKYYGGAAASVDAQLESESIIYRLTRELQESTYKGVWINKLHNGILFISARDSTGHFIYYNQKRSPHPKGLRPGHVWTMREYFGMEQQNLGIPYWQKWVYYYLDTTSASNTFSLMRVEGNLLNTTFPTFSTPVVPMSWDSWIKRGLGGAQRVGMYVKEFHVEFAGCEQTGKSIDLKIVTSKAYAGLESSYNPGLPTLPCSTYNGNWITVRIMN